MDIYQSHNKHRAFTLASNTSKTIKNTCTAFIVSQLPLPEARGSQLEAVLPIGDI